jgi:hypothetical protein
VRGLVVFPDLGVIPGKDAILLLFSGLLPARFIAPSPLFAPASYLRHSLPRRRGGLQTWHWYQAKRLNCGILARLTSTLVRGFSTNEAECASTTIILWPRSKRHRGIGRESLTILRRPLSIQLRGVRRGDAARLCLGSGALGLPASPAETPSQQRQGGVRISTGRGDPLGDGKSVAPTMPSACSWIQSGTPCSCAVRRGRFRGL